MEGHPCDITGHLGGFPLRKEAVYQNAQVHHLVNNRLILVGCLDPSWRDHHFDTSDLLETPGQSLHVGDQQAHS